MTLPTEPSLQKLQFYVTTPYTCGYLPKKMAQSLIATPQHLISADIYSGLITQGFRRSGKFAYRPHCETCRACIAVRLNMAEFAPSRSQKRAFKQHVDLSVRILPLHFNNIHFALYAKYQAARHAEDQAINIVEDDNKNSDKNLDKNLDKSGDKHATATLKTATLKISSEQSNLAIEQLQTEDQTFSEADLDKKHEKKHRLANDESQQKETIKQNHNNQKQNHAKNKDEAEQYRQFLCQSNVESLMIEFSDAHNQVKMISVVDIVNDGVSAVYTFYDTDDTKSSYGTFSIMWQAQWTKSLELPFLYLGYWIENSAKMAYKQRFQPQQKLIDGEWI